MKLDKLNFDGEKKSIEISDRIVAAKVTIIFSIAWVAGFIIPGAPGGIGVREAVIIFFLTPIIGEAESITVSIGLRLVTLLGDICFLIISNKKIKF